MIYLDQAATSFPKIKEVQDAVIDCMNHCTNANRSTSVTSLNASRLIYQTRKLIKEYFHVPQDGCVVLNSGNTESINTCIKGILKKGDVKTDLESRKYGLSAPGGDGKLPASGRKSKYYYVIYYLTYSREY